MATDHHVSNGTRLVRAAGTFPWRVGPLGIEVLMVHRPRFDDWSLPKGKLDDDEAWDAAAVRETEEETGRTGRLGPELCGTAYQVREGPKLVRYWLLEVDASDSAIEFEPNREVDQVRWLPVEVARRLASYATDRAVIISALRHLV